jgi:hypothetical protein
MQCYRCALKEHSHELKTEIFVLLNNYLYVGCLIDDMLFWKAFNEDLLWGIHIKYNEHMKGLNILFHYNFSQYRAYPVFHIHV